MRRLPPGVSRPLASFCAALCLLATGCFSDHSGVTFVSVHAPLTSATSTVVFARVTAEQGGVTTTADIAGGDDSATLALRVGEPAVITGTVFTFEAARWRSFSSTQILTPDVGSTVLELTLAPAPSRTGTAVPTVTVHGEPQEVLGERLPITINDVTTGFSALTPFVTGDTIDLPAGREVVLSVPDRFSGGEGTRQLDSTTFAAGTQIPLTLDATIDVVGLDVDGLALAFTALDGNNLGLECAVDDDCAGGTFVPCTPAGIKLATERSYTVAVRYAAVPQSCTEAQITRDLTPPALTVTTSPLFVQAGLTDLTMVIDANEPIAPNAVTVTAGGATNRCVPTAVSASKVSCLVSLAGLDLSAAVAFGLDVRDQGGQHALRTVTVPARNLALPVQVVGLRTIAEQPTFRDYAVLAGVTVAAFDGQPLCGISPQQLDFALDPQTSFQTSSSFWYGPSLVPPKPVGTANVATYWASLNMSLSKVGTYHVTGSVTIPACGARGATTAPIDTDVVAADRPARWLTPGPLVISPLPNVGISSPLALVDYGYDGLESSDSSIVDASGGEGFYVVGLKPGRARLSTIPSGDREPGAAAPATIDVDVVGPPEILAAQQGRLVRRGRSSDTVTLLPGELGNTLRVFWESEREIIAVVGEKGVWLQRHDGTTQMVLNPCGADTVLDAALTSTVPRHPAVSPNLAVLVQDSPSTVRHCELDLATGTVVADVAVNDGACALPYKLAGDTSTGRFFAVGSGCAFLYRRPDATAIDITADGLYGGAGSFPEKLVLDTRSGTALVLSQGQVIRFSLLGGTLDGSAFAMQRTTGTFTIVPSAVAIDPITGVPWVAGSGNDTGNGSTVFVAYPERTGSAPSWIDVARTDPNAYVAPTVILFDPGSAQLYSSRPRYFGVASMLTVPMADLRHGANITAQDYSIRAWPDGLDVVDMVMTGPQPIAMSVAAAAPGQKVTIIGGGFNGSGRDEVFVQGIPATVVSSTRDRVTFVMPESLRAFDESYSYNLTMQVAVRSSGLLSGPVPMRGRYVYDYYADTIDLISTLPGTYIDVPTGLASLCPSGPGCPGGVVLVDATGPAGVLAVRPAVVDRGVTRLGGYVTPELMNNRGFAMPLRVPGQRRIVGVLAASIVEQWPGSYDLDNIDLQSFAAQRELPVAATPLAIAATPDGGTLIAATGAGLSFLDASSFHTGAVAAVSGVSGDLLAVSSGGLVVAASSGSGAVAAARFTGASAAVLPLVMDASACPAGTRGRVLAMVADTPRADVVAATTYPGNVIAIEELVDNGASVQARCRTYGDGGVIAATAAAMDRSASRLVVLTNGGNATLYDTADMRLPIYQQAVGGTPTGVLMTERGRELYFYGAQQYSLQPMYTP